MHVNPGIMQAMFASNGRFVRRLHHTLLNLVRMRVANQRLRLPSDMHSKRARDRRDRVAALRPRRVARDAVLLGAGARRAGGPKRSRSRRDLRVRTKCRARAGAVRRTNWCTGAWRRGTNGGLAQHRRAHGAGRLRGRQLREGARGELTTRAPRGELITRATRRADTRACTRRADHARATRRADHARATRRADRES